MNRPSLLLKFIEQLIIYCMVLFLVSFIFLFIHESPILFFNKIYETLRSNSGLGTSLFYATNYMFSGLSVLVCLKAGLFNIGVEGQIYMSSLGLILAWILLPGLHFPLSVGFALFVSASLGGGWGALVGYLKTKKNVHEVLSSILLNVIAYAVTAYSILYVFDDPLIDGAQSISVGTNYYMPLLGSFFDYFIETPVSCTLFVALFLLIIFHYIFHYSRFGFHLRCLNENKKASMIYGIRGDKIYTICFVVAGIISSGVSMNYILGYQHALRPGFTNQCGFTAISIALLSLGEPLLLISASFLFGVLENAFFELEFFSNHFTHEFSFIIQGLLIIFMSMTPIIKKYLSTLFALLTWKKNESS